MKGVSVTAQAINFMIGLPFLKVDYAIVVSEAYGVDDKAHLHVIKVFDVRSKHAWVTFVICVRVRITHGCCFLTVTTTAPLTMREMPFLDRNAFGPSWSRIAPVSIESSRRTVREASRASSAGLQASASRFLLMW
jgi:hypothetical protein